MPVDVGLNLVDAYLTEKGDGRAVVGYYQWSERAGDRELNFAGKRIGEWTPPRAASPPRRRPHSRRPR